MSAVHENESQPTDNATGSASPRIIPRSEHPISRNDIDRDALKVLYRLRDAGHAAYLVGGGVRDLLLGKKPKDFDISTDARPGQLRKIFKNSRLIGKRFRLVQVFFFGGKIIEVSTFRCHSEYDLENINNQEQVLPANNTFGNTAEDAFRRDLTINALFYEIENFTLIDYTGGVADLEQKVIRIIGDPERRIIRDPVRMMRAIRHAARNDFTIEEKTLNAIQLLRHKLSLCPVSRIRDEFFKDLRSSASRAWMNQAFQTGLIDVLLPVYGSGQPGNSLREKCAAIMGVADRLRGHEIVLADHILLALVLLPWADAELHLTETPPNEQRGHKFTGNIRASVDNALNHLSIKRSQKDTITLLFANLCHLEKFKDVNGKKAWPKWLTRKSYFKECRLVYQILQEAKGGARVDETRLQAMEPLQKKPADGGHGRKRTGRRRKSRGPAFSPKKNGGIFGLKG